MRPDVESAVRTNAAAGPAEISGTTLRAAQARDPAACRVLIERYQRPVGAVLRRLLASAGLDSLTEDLAQETFVRAFGALMRFDENGPAKLSTWLLRIATRLALQEIQRGRLPLESLSENRDDLLSPTSAALGYQRVALGRAIRSAVGLLPAEQRAVFILREYEGLSYDEIAQVVEAEVGTVRSRLHRARAALRVSLKELRDE